MKDVYIILGAPGSGKSEQADLIAKEFNLYHVSWDIISRKLGFDVGEELNDRKRALLIFDIIREVVLRILGERSRRKNGIVFEGFPRRKEEGILLIDLINKYKLELKAVININSSFPLVRERLKKKLPEREIKKEFTQFLEENVPLYNFLKNHSAYFFTVSGDEDKITVFANIISKIRNKAREDYRFFYRQSSSYLPTRYGAFKIYTYLSRVDYSLNIVLVKGNVRGKWGVLTRVHSSCFTGDIFGSLKCDCGEQLHKAMRKIEKEGCGIIIYLFQEGRGINIINKIAAYSLQEKGFDTIEANERLGFPSDMRNYYAVKDILSDLNVNSIRLLTNNPEKVYCLTDLGIVIEEIVRIESKPNRYNKKYLFTKKNKMNHRLKFLK